MSQAFILLYYPGSGSSWLMDMVAHAPGVWVPGFEPLEHWHWETSERKRLRWLANAVQPAADADRWLSGIRAAPKASQELSASIDVVGFKMTADAIRDHDKLLALLRAADVRVLFLVRDNRLKHALSLYRSYEEAKNQFRFAGELPPTEVEFDAYDHWLAAAEEWHAKSVELRDLSRQALGPELVATERYEDMLELEGKDAMLDRVCCFIGVPRGGIGGPGYFRKATADTLADAIVNYDEFASHFAGTRYGSDLDP